MKLFVSSDIEGTCGIAHWDETEIGKPGYDRFSEQMTKEVAAVCETALQSGKTQEILIKDAHDSARNLKAEELPEEVKLLRGWVGVPCNMMAGVRGCDAAVMTGYHSGAYSDGNPLSHTSNTHNMFVKINGEFASEFRINAMFAAYYGIPVLFVSGDRALCASAETIVPGIVTAPVNEGMGGATLSRPAGPCAENDPYGYDRGYGRSAGRPGGAEGISSFKGDPAAGKNACRSLFQGSGGGTARVELPGRGTRRCKTDLL
jgi:D-amino peptidase